MTIFDDKRKIASAVAAGDEREFWRVGYRKVTKIAPYQEIGHGAYVTWLAIYAGNEIVARVNCAALEYIAYA